MIDDQANWYVHRNVPMMTVDFHLASARHVAEPVLFTMVERETHAAYDPAMRLTEHHAQQLFQQLWDAGFRPNEGSGAGAHVAALQDHITDLRNMAFLLLKAKAV